MTDAVADLTESQIEMAENIGNPEYWHRRLNNPEDRQALCQDWHGLALVAGKETKRLMREMIDERFSHLEALMGENNSKLIGLIEELGGKHSSLERRRREDRELIDSHSQQLQTIQFGMAQQSLKFDQCLEMVKMTNGHISTLSESVSNIGDTVGTLANIQMNKPEPAKSATTVAKPQNSSFLSKVPWQAYVGLGVGIAAVIVYAITGDSSIFKFLGGAAGAK